MARNYTLAPFEPSTHEDSLVGSQSTWTGETMMYSLDLSCVPSSPIWETSTGSGLPPAAEMFLNHTDIDLSDVLPPSTPENVIYRTNGCNVTVGLTGNLTLGDNVDKATPLFTVKQYTGMHIGYWNYNGYADYYLQGLCPPERNATFYAAFAKSKKRDQDPPNDVTAIFCEPIYYQQRVNATVDRVSRSPIQVTKIGEKQPLDKNIFNATHWEAQMTTGSSGYEVRGDGMPTITIPDYVGYIADTNVSIGTGSMANSVTQPLVGLSLAVSELPLEDYLDWKVLSKSYADAYRLIFARTMVEILGNDFASTVDMAGYQQYTTEAVVLEPVFVYIVEGLLGMISLATIMLLYLSITRKRHLRSDPSTIASVMSLVADNEPLLAGFESLDCCTNPEVNKALENQRFRLRDEGERFGIEVLCPDTDTSTEAQTSPRCSNTVREIAKPVRPKEFRLWTAVPFVGLFVALSIALAVIFVRAQANGLPLPSTIKLVQNVLENYIPTALATLIEPMWVMINRLFCMLQPIEELRSCKAKAKDSIDLNYSSLPPQLTVFKALRSKHFVLAMVCAMALLSNLLAIAFAGIFNQDQINMQRAAIFNPPFEMKFVSINGSIGPNGQHLGSREASGAFRGGGTQDQFLIAESNYTRNTSLPAWTDDKMFYLPYMASNTTTLSAGQQYEAETVAFGAELDCETMQYGIDYQARIRSSDEVYYDTMWLDFNSTPRADARIAGCPARTSKDVRFGPFRPLTSKVDEHCQLGPSALETYFLLDASTNATRIEKDACMGSVVLAWIRAPGGSCGDFGDRDLTAQNSLFVRCRPKFVTGQATVRVDGSGRIQQKVEDVKISDTDENDLGRMFSNNATNLIGQSNRYLFAFNTFAWHNDTHASDFMNYFTARGNQSSRLIDPESPVPTLDDVKNSLGIAYSRLFAIWLGANKEKLLVPRSDATRQSVGGWKVTPERRLFLSTPLFIISESILAIYIIVAIIVYLRRPGRYLARMPTSMAAIISLFAASAAVQDMRQTSHLDKKERAEHLHSLGSLYGYGSYVGGGDGRVHIGIEKTPFVRIRSKSTWFEEKVKSFRKGSAVEV
jgi:hypothetical protein